MLAPAWFSLMLKSPEIVTAVGVSFKSLTLTINDASTATLLAPVAVIVNVYEDLVSKSAEAVDLSFNTPSTTSN